MTFAPVSPNHESASGWARQARALVVTAMALSLTLLALASEAQAANPRETEAARLFLNGQYPDALKIYVDLAVATGDPAYMCEIGRCYSRMGKPEEASRNLRDCLSQAKLTPKKKREYQALQAEVEASRVAQPAGPPPGYGARPPAGPPPGYQPAPGYPPPPGYGAAPPPGYPPAQGPAYPPNPNPAGGQVAAGGPPPGYPPAGQLPAGAPPATAGAPADNQLNANSEPRAEHKGSWMTPTAYVVGGVGVLATAGGVVAGLLAKNKFDEVAKEYNDAKYKNGKTLNTLQYVGYGIGAAGIGTAIILLILAPSSSESHAASGVTVVASPTSVGLAGTF